NQGQLQNLTDIRHISRRGILKRTGQWITPKTPMTRRLVHFMLEQWQPSVYNKNKNKNKNMTSHEFQGMSITTPIQVNKKDHQINVDLTTTRRREKKHSQKKKTPEKAHLDTIRRRERHQKQRAIILEQSKELGRLSDNRFNLLLSLTDNEETDKELSEVDNGTETMKDNEQRNLSKKEKHNTGTQKNGVSKKRQAKTTTEVLITNARGNNQRQVNVSNLEIEQEINILNDTEQNDTEQNNVEQSSTSKDKRKIKTYLQGFKILAYLKDRVNNDQKLKFDLKDAFNEVCAYAKNTIETYDKWVHDHYEAQV
ncbi:unnamed protein product, partial [Rotaria sp. Silwood1]